MYTVLYVKYPFFFSFSMTLEFYRQSLEKYSNIKIHEKPSVATEQFQANRRRDMTKLMVALRNFAN